MKLIIIALLIHVTISNVWGQISFESGCISIDEISYSSSDSVIRNKLLDKKVHAIVDSLAKLYNCGTVQNSSCGTVLYVLFSVNEDDSYKLSGNEELFRYKLIMNLQTRHSRKLIARSELIFKNLEQLVYDDASLSKTLSKQFGFLFDSFCGNNTLVSKALSNNMALVLGDIKTDDFNSQDVTYNRLRNFIKTIYSGDTTTRGSGVQKMKVIHDIRKVNDNYEVSTEIISASAISSIDTYGKDVFEPFFVTRNEIDTNDYFYALGKLRIAWKKFIDLNKN